MKRLYICESCGSLVTCMNKSQKPFPESFVCFCGDGALILKDIPKGPFPFNKENNPNS